MKIIWSPLALKRFEEISDYIAMDNISAANNFIDELFQKVEILKTNTEIGRVVPELTNSIYREIIFGNYRIIYTYDKNTISILTVRNFKQLLSEDNFNE